MNSKQFASFNPVNPIFPKTLFSYQPSFSVIKQIASIFVLNCIMSDEQTLTPTIRATVVERLDSALEIAAQQQGFNGLPFEVEGKLISQVLQELKAKGVITNCVAGNRSWYLKDTAKQLMLRSSKYNNLYAVK